MCELQRSLKASQAEQQEALERSTAAVTLEQKAIQESLLQVYCHTLTLMLINIQLAYVSSFSPVLITLITSHST